MAGPEAEKNEVNDITPIIKESLLKWESITKFIDSRMEEKDTHLHQFDNVERPIHYAAGSIECIDAIEAQLSSQEFRGYLKGNIIKYLWREKHKGGIESLKKAKWYLTKLLG